MSDDLKTGLYVLGIIAALTGFGFLAGNVSGQGRERDRATAAGAGRWTINPTNGAKTFIYGTPRSVAVAFAGLAFGYFAAHVVIDSLDILLGCEDDPDRSDSEPMTANIPSEAAKALGLLAPGDEAYIEVTEVNSDGSVVVMAEMEEEESSDSAAPPAPMQGPALPPELGKMLGT